MDIVTIALMAVICGADDWGAVEDYGTAKEPWLKTFLELPEGIPSHDTFGRVFAKLDPDAFEDCFRRWITSLVCLSKGKLVAIDGKSIRRSFTRSWDKSGMAHMDVHYYISSLDGRRSARQFLDYARGHWSVENNLHWQLDVSFAEDQRRVRVGHGAENFSRLNRIALNLLKNESTSKVGVSNRRKKSGWDDDYLLKVLAG